ncbi:MAG: purine-nucleoside phosphorylase [Bacilli bacterium]|nr:purine-nucleoside phosphorylase [Bacilli bacterium]MBN2877110.1 purine-nucleoside phosphorylase [Bacilli bacterium]
MNTPHINAPDGAIASIVLMPGDPLRAKYIADTFLEDVVQFNEVRNMFGFTGTYHGRRISVMGSGMGMPSIGIYSYELYKFFGVNTIVRIGSCGSYSPDLNLYDTVLVEEAYSESSYAQVQSNESSKVLPSTPALNETLKGIAKNLDIELHTGRIHSSDVFYRENPDFQALFNEQGCIGVEMESFALFNNARVLGKNAACLLTVSDSLVTHEVTTAEERQTAFTNMMKIALELAE